MPGADGGRGAERGARGALIGAGVGGLDRPSRIEVDGVVEALLPSRLCRVRVAGPRHVTAHLADPASRNFVRVVVGDRVRVVLMARDRTRGRIVAKL